MADRLYIDKSKEEKIRDIKQKGYFNYDNQKDAFMLALSLGADLYIKGKKLDSKEGLFNDRDLQEMDKAILYSLVEPELDDIQEITNKEKVYEIAEVMADKGFDILLDKMEESSSEFFILKSIDEANRLHEEAVNKNLFL